MKLAEALQARSDLNTKISQLRVRITNNALVQEGETPAEKPDELIKQLNACIAELEELIARINLNNSTVKAEKKTITEWIAARDALKLRIQLLRDTRDAASRLSQRATRSEIKILSTLDVPSLQKQLDEACAQLRRTDNLIQQANWLTDL